MTVFTWSIDQLTVKPQEDGYSDVVIVAVWRCTGVDGEVSANTIGACSFTQPGNPFVPYSQLTEQMVLDWCWANGVNKSAAEANVSEQIVYFKNPPTVVLPLPWAN